MAALERWAWFGPMVKICQLYSRTRPLPILRWHLIPLPLNLGKCVICLGPRQHEGAESACFRGCTREGDAAAPSVSGTPACLEPWATAEAFHRPEAAMLKGSPSQPREEAWRLWEEGEILGQPPVFQPSTHPTASWGETLGQNDTTEALCKFLPTRNGEMLLVKLRRH